MVSRHSTNVVGSPIKSNLDPIQEMTPPAMRQVVPPPKRPPPVAANSLPTSHNNNNIQKPSRTRRESHHTSGSAGHVQSSTLMVGGGGGQAAVGSRSSRPNTPSGRDVNVRALNLSNLSKSNSTEMPAEQVPPADLLSSLDKKVRPKSFWASWWRF